MVGWTLYNMETGKYYKSSSVGGCFFGDLFVLHLLEHGCFAAESLLQCSERRSKVSTLLMSIATITPDKFIQQRVTIFQALWPPYTIVQNK